MVKSEKVPQSNIENSSYNPEKKEKGRNVKFIIKLGRHAKKEPGQIYGSISKEGKKSAENFGQNLDASENFSIKGFSSKQERAETTRDVIIDSSGEKFKRLKSRSRKELDYKDIESLPNGGWGKYQKSFLKQNYPNFNDLSIEEKQQAMQRAEDYMCDIALNNYKYVEEASRRVAHFLDTQVRMTDKLNEGSRVMLIDVTHNTPLMAFLKKCLILKNTESGKVSKGFSKVMEIGGSFNPMEFFNIKVDLDNSGKKNIAVQFDKSERFKGYEVDFDWDEVSRLSNLYKENNR